MYYKQRMQKSSLYFRQGLHVPLYDPVVHVHACRRLHNKQRVQELIYQAAGYSVSLTEDFNRQRVHESLTRADPESFVRGGPTQF